MQHQLIKIHFKPFNLCAVFEGEGREGSCVSGDEQ